MNNKTIDIQQVKKLLARLTSMTGRVTELEVECARLTAENTELRNRLTRDSEAAPYRKSKQNYLKKLARCRNLIQSRELDTLGRSAIKNKIGCGDKTAAAIQVDLVGEGLAFYTGGGHIKIIDAETKAAA